MSNKHNDGADLLAQAIRAVIEEATENNRSMMKEVKDDMRKMCNRLSDKIGTLNQNMQVQFEEHGKAIDKMIKDRS